MIEKNLLCGLEMVQKHHFTRKLTRKLLFVQHLSLFKFRCDAVNQMTNPIHWRDKQIDVSLKSEFFPFSSSPHLKINDTVKADVGQYKCRVDYMFEQTSFLCLVKQ